MNMYLLNIPFAVLGIAVAILPLLIGMKFQAKEESQLAMDVAKHASESLIESHQFELAA